MISPLPPARLLIADDDIGAIKALSAILSDYGEVFFATGGDQAMTMLRECLPDLVLLDAEMPGMDGFAVCQAIKADPTFADLPILFITAHTDVEIETTALDLGAVDFISKPLNPAIVRARVRTHLALKQRSDELRRLASVDGLTGIANRRALETTLDHEWRRACRARTPLSLLMIDVDFFKLYNDLYGHQAGDDCLRAVASGLAAATRRPGEIVARYGGEEFAIVLPACDRLGAHRFAEKLRGAVAALAIPHAASEVAPIVTISIGVASLVLECDGPSGETQRCAAGLCREGLSGLIAAADQALYMAKRAGRNRVADSIDSVTR